MYSLDAFDCTAGNAVRRLADVNMNDLLIDKMGLMSDNNNNNHIEETNDKINCQPNENPTEKSELLR